jgi:hypothetical protein
VVSETGNLPLHSPNATACSLVGNLSSPRSIGQVYDGSFSLFANL